MKDIKFYGLFRDDTMKCPLAVSTDEDDIKDAQSGYDEPTVILEIDFMDYLCLLGQLDYDIAEELSWLFNVKPDSKYLVVLIRSTWNGASGYRMNTPLEEIFTRDYETKVRDIKIYRRGKIISWIESHHDVPTGHRVIAYRLNQQEQKKLHIAEVQKIIDFAQEEYDKVAQND